MPCAKSCAGKKLVTVMKVAALLVHSDPDAALASQNWFIAHTSSPQVHASLLIAEPSVLEQAPPGTKNWKKHRDERNDQYSPQPPFTREHPLVTRRVGSLPSFQKKTLIAVRHPLCWHDT